MKFWILYLTHNISYHSNKLKISYIFLMWTLEWKTKIAPFSITIPCIISLQIVYWRVWSNSLGCRNAFDFNFLARYHSFSCMCRYSTHKRWGADFSCLDSKMLVPKTNNKTPNVFMKSIWQQFIAKVHLLRVLCAPLWR